MNPLRRLFPPLIPLLLLSASVASACSGPGCADDYGHYSSPYYRDRQDEMNTYRDQHPDAYKQLRDQYPDGPPSYAPPSRPPAFDPNPPRSSAPSMWNQFGPDGRFMTCQL